MNALHKRCDYVPVKRRVVWVRLRVLSTLLTRWMLLLLVVVIRCWCHCSVMYGWKEVSVKCGLEVFASGSSQARDIIASMRYVERVWVDCRADRPVFACVLFVDVTSEFTIVHVVLYDTSLYSVDVLCWYSSISVPHVRKLIIQGVDVRYTNYAGLL